MTGPCPYCGATARHDRRRCRMRKFNADPAVRAKSSARMRTLNADPAFKARRAARASAVMKKWWADPRCNPLAALTPAERADYDTYKRAKYSRAEALREIGRGDLLRAPALEAAE